MCNLFLGYNTPTVRYLENEQCTKSYASRLTSGAQLLGLITPNLERCKWDSGGKLCRLVLLKSWVSVSMDSFSTFNK